MKIVWVLTHEENEGPGLFGDVLRAKGFGQRVVFMPKNSLNVFEANVPDLVLVMGGPMGVYDAEKYPFLTSEIDFLKKRITADKPTLGICLGAQLIAASLGKDVYQGKPGQEIGWSPLTVTAKPGHPVQHLSGKKTNMFHWHGDTFDLPDGAELLASSSLYKNQIFQAGKNVLAVQCHPEITGPMIGDWSSTLGKNVGGSKITRSLEDLRGASEKNVATMNAQSKLFFEDWLKSVGL